MMRNRYQLLLIIAVLLSIFYPSIFGELNSIDDQEIVTIYLNLDKWSLRDVLLPGKIDPLYHRPLIHLSYILDRELWFLSSSFMHLENILVHLVNSLIVFFLARRILSEKERENSYIPLAAALLFGLHPVNTESVNWVSGRTDLLAAFFVLSTSLLILSFCNRKRYTLLLLLAFCTFVLGVLTKEVTLGFLPGAFLFLFAVNEEQPGVGSNGKFVLNLRRRVLPIILLLITLHLVIGYIRTLSLASSTGKIPLTLRLIFDNPFDSIAVMLSALGFYIKKILFPLPLSFAITTISPYYLALGIAIAVISLYLFFRKTYPAALFLSGIGLILPSFPIAFGRIAWTPYAERYVYVASPFLLLALLVSVRFHLRKFCSAELLRVGLLSLLGIFAVVTFHRNFVWLSNLSLYEDTVAKNPGFARIRSEYGIALAREGRYEEAKYQFRKAGELPNPYYNENYALNYANVLAADNDISGVEKVYDEVLRVTKGSSPIVYTHIFSFYSNRLLKAGGDDEREKIVQKLVPYYELHFQKFHDPMVFCQVGKLYCSVGKMDKARASFKEALRLLPERGKDRSLVEKALAKLGET